MNFLTRDDSTSMPSHLVSPLGSSLLGCIPSTNNSSMDATMELDEAQENLDKLVDTIDARQFEYYQMPTSTYVNL